LQCNFYYTATGSCSPLCQLTTEGSSNIQCFDNNTPWDDTDYVILFDLDPQGFNFGPNHRVFGSVVPSLGFYGGPGGSKYI